MVNKEMDSFERGRAAAHIAVRQLLPNFNETIVRGSNGEPLFPLSVKGSISHKADMAVSLVAPSNKVKSIGVDLELIDTKVNHEGLSQRIATASELQWIGDTSSSKKTLTLYSAKESVFKCCLVLFDRRPTFKQIELQFSNDETRFHCIVSPRLRRATLGPSSSRGQSSRAERSLKVEELTGRGTSTSSGFCESLKAEGFVTIIDQWILTCAVVQLF